MTWPAQRRDLVVDIAIAVALAVSVGQFLLGGWQLGVFVLAASLVVIVVAVELVDGIRRDAGGMPLAGRLAIYVGTTAAWALWLTVAGGVFGDAGAWCYPLLAVPLCLSFLPRHVGGFRRLRSRREAG